VPRMSDTKEAFHSQLLEAWQHRSKLLEETIPLLYVEGLSTRDFKRALSSLWGKSGLSLSSISRTNKALKGAFDNWRHRDLSMEEILYLFLDGIYLGVRGNSGQKETMLPVLMMPGVKPDSFCSTTPGSFPLLLRPLLNTLRNASPSTVSLSVTGDIYAPVMSLSGSSRRLREGLM